MDCPLRVGVVGINFKTADLPLREAIARSAKGLMGEAGLFFPHPAVVLSTCNRSEIYFSCPDLTGAHSDLLRFFRREVEFDFEHRLYSYFGVHCLSHLCRVAAGLDSAVVAETEIQRQVKCAYLSKSKSALPAEMHFLFQKSLKVGKEIRTACPSIQGGETIFRVIWDLIQGVDLASAQILFVGNSQINRSLIRFLQRRGMKKAHLCTRHPDTFSHTFLASESECSAEDLALVMHGREILSAWEKYELIFCGSQADEYLLHPRKEVEKCTIFDLSVPRNVNPLVRKISGISLYNIEELHSLLKEREAKDLDIADLEERVRNHALRLCAAYRKKQNYNNFSQLCALSSSGKNGDAEK